MARCCCPKWRKTTVAGISPVAQWCLFFLFLGRVPFKLNQQKKMPILSFFHWPLVNLARSIKVARRQAGGYGIAEHFLEAVETVEAVKAVETRGAPDGGTQT